MTYKKLIRHWFLRHSDSASPSCQSSDCDNPDFCFDFGIPSFFDNITGSSVNCKRNPAAAESKVIRLDISTGLGTATGTFTPK